MKMNGQILCLSFKKWGFQFITRVFDLSFLIIGCIK